MTARRWPVYEAIAGWLLRPPPLPPALERKVEAIVAGWDAETARTGKPPVQRMVQTIFALLDWLGRHGPELRRAVDALSIATHWAHQFADLSDEERLALIKRALARYVEELGLGGTLFQRVAEIAIDLTVDAAVALMRKRLTLS